MKDFKKSYGWLVKVIGGPAWTTVKVKGKNELQNFSWIRSWNGNADATEEANSLRNRICAQGDYSGWYVKEAVRKKDNSLKEVTHDKVKIVAWQYRWEEKHVA